MNNKKVILWLAGSLLVVGVAYMGYKAGGLGNLSSNQKVDNNNIANEVSSEIVNSTTTNNNGNIAENKKIDFDFSAYRVVGDDVSTSTPFQYYSLPTEIGSLIQWFVPTEINQLGFFYPEQGVRTIDVDSGSSIEATKYYVSGSFDYQGKKGAIVFADVGCNDCFGGVANPATMFVLFDNKIVLADKMMVSSSWSNHPSSDYIVRKSILIDKNFNLADLNLGKTINIVKDGKAYTLEASSHDEYIMRSHDAETAKKFYEHPILGTIYQSGNKFEAIGKDGRSWYYQYYPKFLDNDGNLTVIFNNKKQNTYKYVTRTGCGFNADPAVVNVTSSTLQLVGAISGKYPAYIIKDNEQKLRQQYDAMYFPDGESKISYEKFVAENPTVYFYDDFSRLVEVTSVKYAPAVECGKPVIYLYPTKKTKVSVEVSLSNWSYSDPKYQNGWEVIADKTGELVDVRSGKKYPYLFWEGTGVGEQPKQTNGFVVKRDNVSNFFQVKLALLGLNEKESADFRGFWEPRMNQSPYYFITFYGTADMNKIAPLTINPKPDTLIRVLMDYRPLQGPIKVTEQKLSTPTRRGFTVVEWGGVLGRE